MNNNNRLSPEQKYDLIFNSGNIGAAILFLNKEVSIILKILSFIKMCKNDEEFDIKSKDILKDSNKIRLNKLLKIKKYLKFYQFKAKRYYQKLIDLILEHRQYVYLDILTQNSKIK